MVNWPLAGAIVGAGFEVAQEQKRVRSFLRQADEDTWEADENLGHDAPADGQACGRLPVRRTDPSSASFRM